MYSFPSLSLQFDRCKHLHIDGTHSSVFTIFTINNFIFYYSFSLPSELKSWLFGKYFPNRHFPL